MEAYLIPELLPHSGPMVLLDDILEFDEQRLVARTRARGRHLLPGDLTRLPAWFGIEYMAQAIALYVGIRAKQAGEPIRLGFLLGTRQFSSNVATIECGEPLQVSVEKIMRDGPLGVFECHIAGANIDIHAHLNVYQPHLLQNG